MQCARAILVTWLGSGSCHNRPSGWILMMTNDDYKYNYYVKHSVFFVRCDAMKHNCWSTAQEWLKIAVNLTDM